MKLYKIFCLFLFLCANSFLLAQNIPPRPDPPRLVNDLAGTMSQSEKEALETMVRQYNDSTSTQIAIVTVQSVGEYAMSDVALKILRDWGIGSKENNNGVVILSAMQDKKIWISTGYGMEGVLPDVICKRIIDEHIRPNFKQKNYYQGFQEAIASIAAAAKGEYSDRPSYGGKPIPTWLIVLLVLVILFIVSRAVQNAPHQNNDGHGGTIFWGGGYNDWGGGRGGGGRNGGDSGGGFDFGGGSGGGGGAGGDW